MKKLLILALSLGLCAPGTLMLKNMYSRILRVYEVNKNEDLITFVDSSGNLWDVYGVEDWELGDYASAIFYDNNTSSIEDDVIVKVRFERVDLIP